MIPSDEPPGPNDPQGRTSSTIRQRLPVGSVFFFNNLNWCLSRAYDSAHTEKLSKGGVAMIDFDAAA